MTLLSIAIIVSLLITIGLPIGAGVWLNKKLGLTMRMITYGVLGYLIVQILITLSLSGMTSLAEDGTLSLTEDGFTALQVWFSIGMGAILGVLIRWAGMKFIREDLINPVAAYGIGIGYGGIESILLVGLPLLTTFITMLSNRQIDPQTTTLDPVVIEQLEALWQVPIYVPLVGSLERVAAFVMHLAVTMLILRVFTRNQGLFLAAAMGLEFLVNGLVVGLTSAGLLYGWVVPISLGLIALNGYLLYRLGAFGFIYRGSGTPTPK